MLYTVLLGKVRFKLGLTRWAGQNQFYPGKMPTQLVVTTVNVVAVVNVVVAMVNVVTIVSVVVAIVSVVTKVNVVALR